MKLTNLLTKLGELITVITIIQMVYKGACKLSPEFKAATEKSFKEIEDIVEDIYSQLTIIILNIKDNPTAIAVTDYLDNIAKDPEIINDILQKRQKLEDIVFIIKSYLDTLEEWYNYILFHFQIKDLGKVEELIEEYFDSKAYLSSPSLYYVYMYQLLSVAKAELNKNIDCLKARKNAVLMAERLSSNNEIEMQATVTSYGMLASYYYEHKNKDEFAKCQKRISELIKYVQQSKHIRLESIIEIETNQDIHNLYKTQNT